MKGGLACVPLASLESMAPQHPTSNPAECLTLSIITQNDGARIPSDMSKFTVQRQSAPTAAPHPHSPPPDPSSALPWPLAHATFAQRPCGSGWKLRARLLMCRSAGSAHSVPPRRALVTVGRRWAVVAASVSTARESKSVESDRRRRASRGEGTGGGKLEARERLPVTAETTSLACAYSLPTCS